MVTSRRQSGRRGGSRRGSRRRWQQRPNEQDAHPKEDSMATKAEMIDAVADAAGVSKADAERTLGAFFDHVVSATKEGEKVAWPGFGSFSTTKRSARTGRNPQTGAPVKIAASTAMKFTASSTLKAALNPG